MTDLKNTVKTADIKELTFSKAYEGFHPAVRKEIYAKIMNWTEWSKYTFYAKKNGVHSITALESKIIHLIFLDYGVDAWTGEEVAEVEI